MIIERVDIHGFGKLQEFDLTFHPHMNLIYGPNEAGKSTLQQAILHLLYGFYHASKARQEEKRWHERFRPWKGERYGGRIIYSLSDGERFEIVRDFSDPDVPTRIFDAFTGREITSQFPQRRHGNIPVLQKHIGMSKEIFEATVFVRQAQVKSLSETPHLMNDIMSILDSGGKDVSARNALRRLEDAIRSIGSERATKRPLPQKRARLGELQTEFAALIRAREELREAVQEKNRLEHTLQKEREKEIRLDYQIVTKSIEIKDRQLQRLRAAEDRLRAILEEIKNYEDVRDFQESARDRISQRQQNLKAYQEREEELKQKYDEAKKQLEDVQEQIQAYEKYESIRHRLSLEGLEVLKQGWLQAAAERDRLAASVRQEEMRLLELGVEEEAIREFRRPDISQRFQRAHQLEEKIEQEKREQERLQSEIDELEKKTWAKKRVRNGIVIGCPVAALAAILGSYFLNIPIGYVLGLLILVAGAALLRVVRAARGKIEQDVRNVQEQLGTIKRRQRDMQDELDRLLRPFGARSFADLVQRKSQADDLVRREQELSLANQQVERLEFQLLKDLELVGIREITAEVLEKVAAEYAVFTELAEKRDRLSTQMADAKKSLARLEEKKAAQREGIASILEDVGIESSDLEEGLRTFEERLQRWQKLQKLLKERDRVQAEIDGILSGQSREELQRELESLLERRTNLLANHPGLEGISVRRTLEALQQERDQLRLSRQENERRLGELNGKIETVLSQHRPQAEIEEEMAILEAEIRELEATREALELARDRLQQVAETYHRSVVPALNELVSEGIQHVTAGRYREVRVDPADMTLNVLIPEIDHPDSADLLSLGTQEQIYLLLRVALARILSENREPLPLILDDPFVHFDHERMSRMLNFLKALSEKNQILLFTKEPFIREWWVDHLEDGMYLVHELST